MNPKQLGNAPHVTIMIAMVVGALSHGHADGAHAVVVMMKDDDSHGEDDDVIYRS